MLAAVLLVLVSPLVFAACTLDFGSYDLEGTSTASGACRYTIQYGVVTERWAWSYIATELGSVWIWDTSCGIVLKFVGTTPPRRYLQAVLRTLRT
jgi:hypothetical protein